jgi:hypothetical protein
MCCTAQVTHRVRSPWALPAILLAMPAAFFAILYGPAHSNLAAARAGGWVQDQVRTSTAASLSCLTFDSTFVTGRAWACAAWMFL